MISVEAKKVDSDLDPGYVLLLTNKTAEKVYVYANPGWTAKGVQVDDPVLRATVNPGQTVEEFMWFDRGGSGPDSLDDLVDIKGVIAVEGYDSAALVGEYQFSV